jgi:hypothetical protein
VPEGVTGFVDGPGLYPSLTARQNLTALAALRGVRDNRACEVDYALEEVGLADVADQRLRGYSLGMRQHLGLGAALLTRPAVRSAPWTSWSCGWSAQASRSASCGPWCHLWRLRSWRSPAARTQWPTRGRGRPMSSALAAAPEVARPTTSPPASVPAFGSNSSYAVALVILKRKG